MHKSVTLLAALLVASILALVGSVQATPMKKQFEDFKIKFNKKYASVDEESMRFVTFAANMKRAAQMQAMNPLATFGANEFADVPAAEFKATHHNGEKHFAAAVARQANEAHVSPDAQLGEGRKIDWRKKGAVVYVKNQGQCGSCWSFSTTGGIEGQWFLAGNKLTSLSEQEFVSCDTIDHGCQGGLMDNAYNWVLKAHNGTLVTAKSYPYVSGDGEVPPCNMNNRKFGAQIYGYDNIAHDEDKMASWVYANGPLSVAVDATSWQTYTGGILSNCISQQLDHGVLIVGFDDQYSTKYWWIKNSWGASWGLEGYLKVEKGTDQCLITKYPCSAKVHKSGPTPPPTPSPPTAPPTPSPPSPPTPKGKDFIQMDCSNSQCSSGCQNHTFPADKCLPLNGGGSAKAHCEATELVMTEYPISSDCSGFSIPSTMPLNQCLQNGDGQGYFENFCTPALSATAGVKVLSSRAKRV